MSWRSFAPAFLPFFLAFRLVYIPASVLTHSGHGQPWLNVALGCAATLGAEWLTRRIVDEPSLRERRRALVVVILALISLGFFPEEAPIGVILWAGSGAAWGAATRGYQVRVSAYACCCWRWGGQALCWARSGCLGRAVGWRRPVLGLGIWRGRGN